MNETELTGRKRELARLALARADMEVTVRLCDGATAAGLVDNDPVYWAFHNAVVVCYGRPFTSNEDVGALSEKWRKFSNERLQVAHDQILNLRDKVVAHADLVYRPIHVLAKGTELPNGVVTETMMITVGKIGLSIESYLAIRELAMDLLPRLNEAINEQCEVLFPHGYDGPPLQLVDVATWLSA